MGILYAFFTAFALSIAPQQSIPYAKLDAAFDQNNSQAIVGLAKDKVLVNILGTEGAYSRSQAELVLKDFFTKKPNGSFDFIFKGQESSDGSFAIGNYVSGGSKYRVTLHFKNVNGTYRIESITIEQG